MQKEKLKYNIKIKKIDFNFNIKNLKNNELPVYDVKYKQKAAFEKISKKSNKYILNCFDIALKLIKNKKIIGIINCPVSKEILFKNKNQGITEFLSNKTRSEGKEVMLIYNKKLSVSPLTTHIPLREVYKKIKKSLIVKKIKVINNFYIKYLKKKPNISILGLNPHNYSLNKKKDEKKIIISAVKKINKMKIKAKGPISPDTSFVNLEKNKTDVILGMYHDQVLTPYKTLFEYNAINITLGIPFIRISPDHGVGINIIGKKIANPTSLIESIKFFNQIKS